MPNTYYAWTNFVLEYDEWGRAKAKAEPGDVVTQEMLQVTDEVWSSLIENGQVREQPYPKIPSGSSPVEYYKHLQAKAAKGKLTQAEVLELQTRVLSLPAPEPPINPPADVGKETSVKLPF